MGFRMFPETHLSNAISDQKTTRTAMAGQTAIMYNAEVIANDDPNNYSQVKVRLAGIDDFTKIEDLPWCKPMTPSFIYCLPQIGDHVLVLLLNPWNKTGVRFYMGPIGDQPYSGSMKALGFDPEGGL